MSKFKPYPELYIVKEHDGGDTVVSIRTKLSEDDFMAIVVQRAPEDAQRFVDCWNACRKLSSPAAHMEATDEYVARLETLRKEAWARAVELGSNDFRPSAAPDMELAS